MASAETIVTSADELVASARDASVRRIVVRSALFDLPSCRLAPGQVLVGEGDQALLSLPEAIASS